MSKIGKQTIEIPEGVKVIQNTGILDVKGPSGNLSRSFRNDISINITDKNIILTPKRNDKFSKSLWGTYASHIRNMIKGVQTSYQKKLIIEGVGYKVEAKKQGDSQALQFALGFSHPVIVNVPQGLNVIVEKNNINIIGSDKDLVGSFSAHIRSLKKPEPYKGKGIHYDGEIIRRKQGKKVT